MFAFWLGTLPALLLAGASAARLNRCKAQPRYRRLAGVIMIVFGLIALSLPFLHTGGGEGDSHHHASTLDLLASEPD